VWKMHDICWLIFGPLKVQLNTQRIKPSQVNSLLNKRGWIEKARQQQEKVKQVVQKIRTDAMHCPTGCRAERARHAHEAGVLQCRGSIKSVGEG